MFKIKDGKVDLTLSEFDEAITKAADDGLQAGAQAAIDAYHEGLKAGYAKAVDEYEAGEWSLQ